MVLIGGLVLAVVINSRYIVCRRFFELSNFLPYLTTPVAIGVIFALFFDFKVGVVNNALIALGVLKDGINWLGDPAYAPWVVILMVAWKFMGYYMVFFLAGLTGISPELYDAAAIDGSPAFNTFIKITVPLLRPVINFLVITGIIGGMQLLDEPMLLFNRVASGPMTGGPERSCLTAVWDIYDTAFGSYMKLGRAAAISYGLFAVILIFSLVAYRFFQKKEDADNE